MAKNGIAPMAAPNPRRVGIKPLTSSEFLISTEKISLKNLCRINTNPPTPKVGVTDTSVTAGDDVTVTCTASDVVTPGGSINRTVHYKIPGDTAYYDSQKISPGGTVTTTKSGTY